MRSARSEGPNTEMVTSFGRRISSAREGTCGGGMHSRFSTVFRSPSRKPARVVLDQVKASIGRRTCLNQPWNSESLFPRQVWESLPQPTPSMKQEILSGPG